MRNEKRNDSDPFGRKPTSLRTLVLLILMLATATGSGLANARVKDCGELPGFGDPPVKREALGENWQFNKDADKLPIFRKLIADGGLNLTPSNSKPPSFCKSFLRDLMAGKPIEVIEPELEVMSVDDPRLGPFPCYRREDGTVLGECGLPVEKRGRWHQCNYPSDAAEKVLENNGYRRTDEVFEGLHQLGLPPYRFYRFNLKTGRKPNPQDVVLHRSKGNGAFHIYTRVKLETCEKAEVAGIASHRICMLTPNAPDDLSLLIRYRGIPMFLSFLAGPNARAILAHLAGRSGYCDWESTQNTK